MASTTTAHQLDDARRTARDAARDAARLAGHLRAATRQKHDAPIDGVLVLAQQYGTPLTRRLAADYEQACSRLLGATTALTELDPTTRPIPVRDGATLTASDEHAYRLEQADYDG